MLEVYDLAAGYGREAVISDVSFRIAEGELTVLRGPNASGKSTLVSALTGVVRPIRGTVRVAGHDLARDAIRAKENLSVAFQSLSVDGTRTVTAVLSLHCQIYGLDPHAWVPLADSLALQERSTRIVWLSGGTQKKVELIKCLAAPAKVYILDEPTAGLDAMSVDAFWSIVDALRARGSAAFIITHESVPASVAVSHTLELVGGRLMNAVDQHLLVAEGANG